ncbi:NB-ARC domains-containing protein [Tanacetum coccineum]
MLHDGPLHVGENLVGIDSHFDKLDLLRFVGPDKVNMIRIYGISGIGKTTLAKAIYNSMHTHFHASCFCDDVQEVKKWQGLTQVQMEMIGKILKTDLKIPSVSEGTLVIKRRMACKRILLVLDDVNNVEQLEALAGSSDWFFPRSLIIFTGKDKQFLRSPFGSQNIGRSLYEKSVHFWKSELERLQTYPNSDIQQKLQQSFNGLPFDQKRMFLDMACAFIRENKDLAASVLDSGHSSLNAIIKVLADKFLITVSSNGLQMNELIQSMTRVIIREEFY